MLIDKISFLSVEAGNTVLLVWISLFCKKRTNVVSCHTADSKPVKEEVNSTVILSIPFSIPWSKHEVAKLACFCFFRLGRFCAKLLHPQWCRMPHHRRPRAPTPGQNRRHRRRRKRRRQRRRWRWKKELPGRSNFWPKDKLKRRRKRKKWDLFYFCRCRSVADAVTVAHYPSRLDREKQKSTSKLKTHWSIRPRLPSPSLAIRPVGWPWQGKVKDKLREGSPLKHYDWM